MSKMRKPNQDQKQGYILRLRQSRTLKGISMTLALSLLFEMIQPTVSMALTEGPSQPEVQSFEPIGTTQMVDLFTGDFNYNIPLFNLPGPNGGYPVNIAYHAGVSMDDEASWVGLGWNLNVGSLVRNMRGLPDEFLSTVDSNGEWSGGDFIETKTDMKASWTLGANWGKKFEILGGNIFKGTPGINLSISYNNFRGLGASVGGTYGLSKSPFNFGLSLDSDNGLGVSANLNLSNKFKSLENNFELGLSFNGSPSLSYNLSKKKGKFKQKTGRNGKKAGLNTSGVGSSLSYARGNFVPSIANRINNYSISGSYSWGPSLLPATWASQSVGIFFNTQDFNDTDKKGRKRPVAGYAEAKAGQIDFTKDFVRQNDGQITKESSMLPHSYYAHDAYNSSGQGLSGYFRGRRNDVGKVHDPRLRNESWGMSLDFEASIPNINNHAGVGGTISSGWDGQLPWNLKNELNYDFDDPIPDGIQENLFYQVHGEQTIVHPNEIAHMRGAELALVQFEPKNTNIFTGGKREINYNTADNYQIRSNRAINITNDADRVVRNTLVHTLKNEEVDNLGEFQIGYYDYDNLNGSLDLSINPQSTFNRGSRTLDINHAATDIGGHNAGFKVLNEEGSYYVYGLPAYNTKEVENLFSVDTPTDPTDFLYHNQVNTVDIVTNSNEVDYKRQGTHKMINKKTKSPYAHSYMLTSVQGADYVDLENDGPSDDDLGYWVKFDYVKYGSKIKWRAPFQGANYSQGQTYTGQDDKGSYQYGEKEQWYLGRMETKSHIAIFEMSERSDMVEAAGEFVNSGYGVKSGLKIDKIKVYEKASFESLGNDAVPLQVVNFEYDYSLCQGVLNNDNAAPSEIYEFGDMDSPYGNVEGNQGGKLTLKRVYFTSLNSKRGTMSPYEFDYTSVATPSNYNAALLDGGVNNLVNPSYQQNAYDPWGGYRPYATYASSGNNNGTYDGGYQQHSNFPYVAQTSHGWMQQWSSLYSGYSGSPGYTTHHETISNKEITKQANDLIASTWSLKEIKLPSGGKIKIEYESDDYSHVQHKIANQMFKIVKIGTVGNGNNPSDRLYENGNENGFYSNDNSSVDEERRRIYFRLEEPLKVGELPAVYANEIFNKYVAPITKDEGGKRNLYFKSRMRLTFNANDNNVYEYVRGYLPLEGKAIKNEATSNPVYNCGVLNQLITDLNTDGKFTDDDGDLKYGIGFVTIEPAQRKNGNFFDKYHPMALAAWTYMQTNAQELLNPSSTMNSISAPSNTGEVLGLLTNILNVVPATAASFGLIRPYCKGENFAQFIDLANSGIRLASPDRKKYGGGHRVKQITITDEWESDTGSQEDSRTYGQVYDYTTEEDGMTMSSGVAQYEPQAGGDENALKYPIHFYGKNKMFTNNNLFAEAPMNEALFPGAMVGYRKVTVRSLNTSKQMKNALPNSPTAEGRTGGISEHEFYTGKGFPTMVEWSTLSESNNTKDVFNLPIPIPFIGSIKRNYYHGSQAFKIELNDMHGKPKSVKTYELNNYARNSAPITEAFYEYQSKPIVYQGEQVRQLVSEVQVIPQSGVQDLTNTESRLMGVEVDLFTDQRENKSLSTSGGLDFNADIIGFLPIPSFWPSFSNHKTMFRTYVTNKVVHRSGILVKTKTRDLQTTNETEILAYDEKSGTPLVTKVKNEFGDNFYSYNVPAYYHYDRMGHAYRNINYSFDAYVTVIEPNGGGNHRLVNINVDPTLSNVADYLVRGDELLVVSDGISSGLSNDYIKGYFLGWTYNASGDELLAKIQLINPVATVGAQLFKFKVIRSGRRNHYGSMAANYLSKGELLSTWTQTIDAGNNSNEIVTTPIIYGNVLSATASLFKDDWSTTGGDANISLDPTDGPYTSNPFLSGNSGIWRPYKSYTYVGSRSGASSMVDNSSSDPQLYNDGVMTNVPMFTWDLGNIEDYDLNWEWVNEVTRFSQDAYEVENVNRLGIYSSALYGYDNSLTIAVGGNASTYELGAFDFELGTGAGKLLSQTNMDFDLDQTTGGSVITTEQHGVVDATMGAGNVLTIKTNIPATGFNLNDYETNIGLALNTRKGVAPKTNEGFFFNGETIGVASTYMVGSETFIQFNAKPFIENGGTGLDLLPVGSRAYGKVTLMISKINETSTVQATYNTEKAHTGKYSLKVTGLTEFDQPQLKLINGKHYVVSVWVSSNMKKRTYENDGLVGIGTTSVGNAGITDIKTTHSKVIEGWQKVDFEFLVDQPNATLKLLFNNTPSETTYIDDVRFSPRTGGITTYVYDPTRFWLRASLNVDNYATLFFYDEEGNLTIKKQETEEGIFTITESRGHVSE